MKYCPSCRTEYADDTLQFCLQDGTRLAAATADEPETVVRPHGGEPIRFDVPTSSAESFSPPLQQSAAPTTQFPVQPKKSKTGLAVALTALLMLVLFGAIGAGAWFYLKKNQTEIAGNTNAAPNVVNQNAASGSDSAKNSNAKKSPTPKPGANANAANVNSNAAPIKIDADKIEAEISESLENWKSSGELRDLNAYMNAYADTVDYYSKKGASRAFVQTDKQRAFTKFDRLRLDLSSISVAPDASGERATVAFDKEWEFSGASDSSAGKVRQQLSFRKIGGRWLITGEKDLKVYYTE